MQCVPDFPHRGIDSVVGIQEDAFAPDALQNFLARNELPASVGQNEEQLEGDALQLHGTALAPELVSSPVKLVVRETADIRRHLNPLGEANSSSVADHCLAAFPTATNAGNIHPFSIVGTPQSAEDARKNDSPESIKKGLW